ncbi:dipeptide/oligopeptide/nickel ABC transporter permease/ATP-binding protein [Nocardioides sp. cx-173]|uniref:dipeptide/oligopeptide/nickel ABC transporter permease/ATP-binding protein n=1 Tax=Nocardioides sp. cx-173 TaxID=2898796 RepID=UPI001E4C6358|nr:dipeptide/oligopeptide/nickel ABC transporter permease/ATP-binding protein [Nocardioides sp. cx-173]MCD4524518.1 dipeptide/oligopeptide/nickel ABC transporter permease/ATP-binding protein [Nocardioides sp. cx-173]UGB42997.1 dipeptide/oligopeptide/nickel ABC transporter permease/ATP-binding protein [Nocardioides sp. cx-173]
MRRLLSTPLGLAAFGSVVLLLALMGLAPLIWGDQASEYHTDAIVQGPSAEHFLGTDNLGRDILLRVLVATRLAVGLALLATLIGLVLGVLIGSIGALAGPRVSRFADAAVSVAVAFPGLLLAIFFAIIFGVGQTGAVLALGVAAAPWFARLTQTLVASVLELEYVAAARVIGIGRFTVLRRHILPNIGEPLVINAAMGAGGHLLAFAGLSFLGIGVQPPDYDWGRLLLEGVANIYSNPAAALGPGLAIAFAGLAFSLTGEVAASALGSRDTRVPAAPRHRAGEASGVASGGAAPQGDDLVLDVVDLRVEVPAAGGTALPVRGVSIRLRAGESLGIVGESGSGKSLTAMAIARLLEAPLRVEAGRLAFDGHDLRVGSEREVRTRIADSMAVIFQDPMSSLNPALRVGRQLSEVAEVHQGLTKEQGLRRAVQVLDGVRIPEAERRARQYPHEFSGGMRQRAMIGIGLMGRPRLLIADEPTTALDVSVQHQVLELLSRVRSDADAALILISHDLAVVTGICDRVAVMYAGQIVEQLSVADLRSRPAHPYTRALLAAVPDLGTDRERPLASIPGRPPRPAEVPPGCAFADRCPVATARCHTEQPPLDGPEGHLVACWHPQSGPIRVVEDPHESEPA